MVLLVSPLLAYLLGSVVGAHVLALLTGSELTKMEGNPGASNILRKSGVFSALFVAVVDVGKGWLVMYAALHFLDQELLWLLPVCMLSVILGHMYPVFFRFKGGKGVATLMGALMAIAPMFGLFALLAWICAALVSGYASVASLAFTWLFVPLIIWIMPVDPSASWLITALFICLLISYRHKDNLARLWSGQEPHLPLPWFGS